jgi:hypothetical protein
MRTDLDGNTYCDECGPPVGQLAGGITYVRTGGQCVRVRDAAAAEDAAGGDAVALGVADAAGDAAATDAAAAAGGDAAAAGAPTLSLSL